MREEYPTGEAYSDEENELRRSASALIERLRETVARLEAEKQAMGDCCADGARARTEIRRLRTILEAS